MRRTHDPRWLRTAVLGVTFGYLASFVALPIASVFGEALARGLGPWLHALGTDAVQSALGLTLLVAAIVVPLNVGFGLCAAWLVTRFSFRGKTLLVSLIDLPFSVSPVISGLVFVLLFGRRGVLGAFLERHDIQIVFALPGIVLATAFVTFPFVARELIPALEARGSLEEEAALTLGATGLQTFRRVTIPKIRWALLYGVVLCSARAMGEFGAVSVVSGHVRGRTTTLPLQIEMLYDEYDFVGAFAAASVLTLVAVFALVAKKVLAWRVARREGGTA